MLILIFRRRTNPQCIMYALVYQSKAKLVFGIQEIQEMLKKARKFNREHQITGCLLFYKGDFIQYLEGNRKRILSLFWKIQHDQRHEFVTLLSFEKIERREFRDWDMAYEDFNGGNNQLQYLQLLVNAFMADDANSMVPNPSSGKFWNATKLLLKSKSGKIFHDQTQ